MKEYGHHTENEVILLNLKTKIFYTTKKLKIGFGL